MKLKSRRSVIVGCLLLVAGIMVYMYRSFSASAKAKIDTGGGRAQVIEGGIDPATAKGTDWEAAWTVGAQRINEKELAEAIEAGDAKQWRPLLGKLRDSSVKPDYAEKILSNYISHAEPAVRVAAAGYLLEIGSYAGVPALRDILADVANGVAHSRGVVASSAEYLYKYGKGDADLYFKAFSVSGAANLLRYAQLMRSADVVALTREKLHDNPYIDDSIRGALYAGVSDPVSRGLYLKIFKGKGKPRYVEQAAAALYKFSQDQDSLKYLEDAASRAVLGGLSSAESSGHFGKLSLLVIGTELDEDNRDWLRELDRQARLSAGDSVFKNYPLLCLYYFHRDYDYVDRVLMSAFSPGGAVPDVFYWQLARERGLPSVLGLAKEKNQEIYDREIIRKRGRFAESWVFTYLDASSTQFPDTL